MEINYKELAERTVACAQQNNINLNYSEKSIQDVDDILGTYYDHLNEYDGEKGADTLWNIAVHFGIYIGETLLKLQLQDQGYQWQICDGLPILKNNDTELSPITKAHKRILNGAEDSIKSFCNVALSIANGDFPPRNVHRAIDLELSSGQIIKNVLYKDIDYYIMSVSDGVEDFLILNSHDGFLQFFGIDSQFVAELWIELPNSTFRTYSIIDNEKKHLTNKVELSTPFCNSTPPEREVISLELLKTVIQTYYENITKDDLLKKIPCIETTDATKRYMERRY